MPKVSVIIPVYGVEKYIERCARSLFEQTLDDIEYLFIDDCTPDNSIGVLKSVLEKYPHRKSQVIIHRMEKNSGQAAVREWGMRNATGEYLIHCDSDDWVDTDMYKNMYEYATINNSDIILTDYFIDKENNSVCNLGLVSNKNSIISNFILRKNKCSLCNKLFRTSLFNNNFIYPKGDMGEDMAIVLQIILYANKIDYINKAFYHYCINENSITQASEPQKVYKRFCQLKSNVELIAVSYKKHQLYETYSKEFISLKYHAKQALEPLINNKEMFQEWKNTFSDINKSILFCPYIKIKSKIIYIIKFIFNFFR